MLKGDNMLVRREWMLLAVLLTAPMATASGNVITDWDEKAIALVQPGTVFPPPTALRTTAMLHLAMFDAVNSVEHRYRPYRLAVATTKEMSREAAAAAAAGAVLAGLNPSEVEELNAATATYLATQSESGAKSEGIKVGREVAVKIVAERKRDGSDSPDAYRPKAKPGVYVPTPITASSMWPKVAPFAMSSPAQFRPQPPIPLNGKEWAVNYNEIKDLGGKNSAKRTAQQTEDARFWLMTGPASYYPIVRQLIAAKKMDLVDSARFMALASTTVADALIAVFDAKYHYDFWRPITAIRNGDIDDNPATELDATWQPIDNTPMHPEYPCAHCISSAGIAAVIEAVLGGADIPEVTVTSSPAQA